MFSTIDRIQSEINSDLIANLQIVPYYNKELFINNRIENDIQSVLRPFNIMQALFICSKYKIRDDMITVNSFTYNFIGVSCMVIFRTYCFYHWFSAFEGFGEGLFMLINWSGIYDNLFFSFGFILNFYCNIKYCHKNVLLVSRIQHALTLLQVNGKELQALKIYNWISVICVNSVFIVTWMVLFYVIPNNNHNIILHYNTLIFDINAMYASFVMKLLCKLSIVWIEDVRRSENIPDSDRKSYWQIKYDVYVDIMDAYNLIEKTFGQLIAFSIIHTACHGLIHIATVLRVMLLVNNYLLATIIMTSQVWLIKSILIVIILCVNCERFYKAVKDVQGALTSLMYSIRCSDKHTIAVCKNIQRIKNTSFKKMSVGGLFIVDAMLSLRLFSFITTYTIVLIQFEFL